MGFKGLVFTLTSLCIRHCADSVSEQLTQRLHLQIGLTRNTADPEYNLYCLKNMSHVFPSSEYICRFKKTAYTAAETS